MFEIHRTWRPASCRLITMAEAQPGQTIWTGEGWSTIVGAAQCQDDPGMVTLKRVTSAGVRFTTDYRAGRFTVVRTLVG